MIVLSLARIIGAAMELATISSPTSVALYTGSAILTNVGFSPLVLATLGLLSRLIDSIHKSHKTIIDTRMLRVIELVILIGLILGIVGGVDAGSDYGKSGHYTPGSLNKAGTALLVVSFAFIIISIIITSFATPHAEQGEHRLFYAMVVALPFLTCRLILKKIEKVEHLPAPVSSRDSSEPMAEGQSEPGEKKENMALKVFKHTILGRVVLSFMGDKDAKHGDVEMQGSK